MHTLHYSFGSHTRSPFCAFSPCCANSHALFVCGISDHAHPISQSYYSSSSDTCFIISEMRLTVCQILCTAFLAKAYISLWLLTHYYLTVWNVLNLTSPPPFMVIEGGVLLIDQQKRCYIHICNIALQLYSFVLLNYHLAVWNVLNLNFCPHSL